MGLCCLLKRGAIYFRMAHAEGIPLPLPVELPRVDTDDGGGAPDGGGGGGGAVGSSMPIYFLMTSKVLSIFLAPSAATPCASSACSSISIISFHDIPSKFGVYLCSLRERSYVATSLSTATSKSSSSLFAPPPPLFSASDDEPLLPAP